MGLCGLLGSFKGDTGENFKKGKGTHLEIRELTGRIGEGGRNQGTQEGAKA